MKLGARQAVCGHTELVQILNILIKSAQSVQNADRTRPLLSSHSDITVIYGTRKWEGLLSSFAKFTK